MKRLPYLLGSTGLMLGLFTVSCTTLGTHVKGGFACKAPQGTCAPMSNIDAQAIAGLGADGGRAMPIAGGGTGSDARMIMTSGEGEPARTGDRTMKVVFPAHSDTNGVFHEEAIAHVVAEWSRWTLRPAAAPEAGSLDAAIQKDAPTTRPSATPIANAGDPTSAQPLNLREAAAGLNAPADPMPDAPREQIAVDMAAPATAAPTADALAAARAGHRIGDPLPQAVALGRHQAVKPRKGAQVSRAKQTVPGAATAALNREQLQHILARSGTAASRSETGDAGKPRQVASAAPIPAGPSGTHQ